MSFQERRYIQQESHSGPIFRSLQFCIYMDYSAIDLSNKEYEWMKEILASDLMFAFLRTDYNGKNNLFHCLKFG